MFDVANPQMGTTLDNSKWLCSTSTSQYGFHPTYWNASYVRSDTEQY